MRRTFVATTAVVVLFLAVSTSSILADYSGPTVWSQLPDVNGGGYRSTILGVPIGASQTVIADDWKCLEPWFIKGIDPAVQLNNYAPIGLGYYEWYDSLYDNEGAVQMAFELIPAIPEPTTMVLVGAGTGALALLRRQRRKGDPR